MPDRDEDRNPIEDRQDRVPPGIDTSKPNIARVYDYMLGGKDNFAIDRQVAEMTLKIVPTPRSRPAPTATSSSASCAI